MPVAAEAGLQLEAPGAGRRYGTLLIWAAWARCAAVPDLPVSPTGLIPLAATGNAPGMIVFVLLKEITDKERVVV